MIRHHGINIATSGNLVGFGSALDWGLKESLKKNWKMKAKHIFNNLSYKEYDNLKTMFPPLNDLPPYKNLSWSTIPHNLRNALGRILKERYSK